MIGESVDVIENLFVRSEGGKCVWAGALAARRTGGELVVRNFHRKGEICEQAHT